MKTKFNKTKQNKKIIKCGQRSLFKKKESNICHSLLLISFPKYLLNPLFLCFHSSHLVQYTIPSFPDFNSILTALLVSTLGTPPIHSLQHNRCVPKMQILSRLSAWNLALAAHWGLSDLTPASLHSSAHLKLSLFKVLWLSCDLSYSPASGPGSLLFLLLEPSFSPFLLGNHPSGLSLNVNFLE